MTTSTTIAEAAAEGRVPTAVEDFLIAARVPSLALQPQSFGLWTIERRPVSGYEDPDSYFAGWRDYTLLRRISISSMHLGAGEVVMEDSLRELSRHLPIWLNAHGRILITGLGLGCVVRGLLASPVVDHIDVVEIDKHVLRIVGREFSNNQRVTLHHGDALEILFPLEARWDFAWHDLWTDGERHLQQLHIQLMMRFRDRVRHQGAWAFPRQFARLYSRHVGSIVGAPRIKSRAA